MKRQFDVWLADLSPRFGTEPGKTRPVLIVQSDLLNAVHPSTLICPITSNVQPGSNILRVHILAGMAGLKVDSDVMIDQIRAIDNRRLVRKIGTIQATLAQLVNANLRVVLRL